MAALDFKSVVLGLLALPVGTYSLEYAYGEIRDDGFRLEHIAFVFIGLLLLAVGILCIVGPVLYALS